jgi:membrane fusion protein (multidrug efflux system)
VIDDQGKVAVLPVELGAMNADQWIITSGLNVGDRVIVSNLQKLRPGAPVRVREQPTLPNKAKSSEARPNQ